MPLPYLWLFAFLIPFSCTATLMAQAEIEPARKPVRKPIRARSDPDLFA